jgi:hypothetical protein
LERADIVAMLMLLAGAVVYAAIWLWPPHALRPSDEVERVRDPDEVGLPPALAGYVLRGGRQADLDQTATLLDLLDRGVIEVIPQLDAPAQPLLVLRSSRLSQVWPHEDAVLRTLFEVVGEREAVALRELEAFARERPGEHAASRAEFRRALAESAVGLQGEPLGRWTLPLSFVIPVVLVWAAIYTVAWTDTLVYLISAAAIAALMLVHAAIMYRRITVTRRYRDRCAGLWRHLIEFVQSDERLSVAHPLWGRYLVYATAFGIGEELKEKLRAGRPETPGEIVLPGEWPWWQAAAGGQPWLAFVGTNGHGRRAKGRRGA